MFREQEIALDCFRLHGKRSARHNQVVHLSLIEARAFLFERNERKRESGDMIAVLEEPAQVVEAGDLRGQDKRLRLAVEREVPARASAVVMGLAQPFDLDLADGLADPFGGARLGGAQEDFRGRLREHGLGILAVAGFHLAAALEAENDRVL